MKQFINKTWIAILTVALAGIIISSCNKDLPEAEPIVPLAPSGSSIMEVLNDADCSILKAAVTRAGATLVNQLSDKTAVFTFFAPNNGAFALLGITDPAFLAAFRPGQLDTLLRAHLIGGIALHAADISTAFSNMYLQSAFVLAPPSATLPPGLRMPIFPSRRNTTAWVNNIPIIQADIEAANGVVHKIAAPIAPPSAPLLLRIFTDPDLTYLKAAIEKADGGDPDGALQSALKNPAANLTVFAPTNAAFQAVLTGQITLALIDLGYDAPTAAGTAAALASTPDVFNNPALADVLTPEVVGGIVLYHILGVRAFSVNIPTTETNSATLLNTVVPTHPGVSVEAVFGPTGVTAATVTGVGNGGAASNIIINPLPNGSSDQNYLNGTLHKIDRVLLPQ
jgi:uncharacterized surface protein with fasciclin (FAS1) repeats